jgi:hypothetical protein
MSDFKSLFSERSPLAGDWVEPTKPNIPNSVANAQSSLSLFTAAAGSRYGWVRSLLVSAR